MGDTNVGAVCDIVAARVDTIVFGVAIDVRHATPRPDTVTPGTLKPKPDAVVAAVEFGARRSAGAESPDKRYADALVVATRAASPFAINDDVGR